MRRVCLLSTADFDSPVWTNKQFIAAGLAESTQVVYIESMGLRRPRLDAGDLRRIVGKLHKRSKRSFRERPAGIQVVPPKVIPFHESAAVRRFNRRYMNRLADRLGLRSTDVLWTFSPLTYGLEDHVGVVVYQSVDLLHKIPGVPERVMTDAEQRLLERADHVIASSRGVLNHLRCLTSREVLLWENVAATDLFEANRSANRLDRAIFAGHFTSGKIHASSLLQVLGAGVQVALAGPIAIDGTPLSNEAQRVLDHPNSSWLGNLSPRELAVEVGRSKVGLIPYEVNPYTEGVFPMKVYEYLAAGLSVVSTPLPSFDGYSRPGVRVAAYTEFAAATTEELDSFSESEAKDRTDYARQFSWTNRIQQALSLIAE